MSKIFANFFPFFDHLYIFQNFEYESGNFFKWFLKNPFKRDLQRKHKLEWTNKAILLCFIGLFLLSICSLILSYILFKNLWGVPILIVLLSAISPFFLLITQLFLSPVENYQKQKIINAAKEKMQKFESVKVVAIVGSFAKTSTKNMLYTLLCKDYRVVKTPKSYNTPISIARTVLSDVKENTEIFLVEMDAYYPGDIKKLCEIVGPDLGIITSIAPQHLSRFGSMEKLAKAQFELAESLPNEGVLFLNSKDNLSMKLSLNYPVKQIFYNDKASDFYATDTTQTKKGIHFILRTKSGEKVTINLPFLGEHNVVNFIAAAAIAKNLGMSLKRISERAPKILPTPHRLEIKKQQNLTIVDNSYNSNPVSSRASLKLLKELEGSQKILITPGLIELGKEHFKENKEFGKDAANVSDEIIVVGGNAREPLLKGLEEANYPKDKTHITNSTKEALALLQTFSKPNAVVLIENDLPDQYF